MTPRQRLREIFQTGTPIVIADIPFGKPGGWVSTRQAADARVHGVIYSGRGEVFPSGIHRWIPDESRLWFGVHFESMPTPEDFCRLPEQAGGLRLGGEIPCGVQDCRDMRRMWEGRTRCEQQLLMIDLVMGSRARENAHIIAECADVILIPGHNPDFIARLHEELPDHVLGITAGASCDNYSDIVGAGADVLFEYGMHYADGQGGSVSVRVMEELVDMARTSGD